MIKTSKCKIIQVIKINLLCVANGNLVTGDSFYREYNGFNQLVRIRQGNTSSGNITEEFIWHPLEERVFIKKIYWNNQTLRTTIKYLNKNTIKIKNESGIFYENYIYQDDILVAQVTADGQKQAVHSDHLGSATLITNSAGNIVENLFYSPYGEQIQTLSNFRYTFTGKEFDTVNNEYDFLSRRSNPDWANRLTTPDKIFYDFTKYEKERQVAYYDPQLINPYVYARNNPYKFKDDSGNFLVGAYFLSSFLRGFVIGLSVSVAYQKITTGEVNYGRAFGAGIVGGVVSTLTAGTMYYTGAISTGAAPLTETAMTGLGKEMVIDISTGIYGEYITESFKQEEDEKEKSPLCEKCYKKSLGTIELPPIKIEIESKKNERATISSASGGRGGSDFVPDPSGRKDRFGNPVYVPRSEIKRIK